ncbi:hypothetical protein LSH36_1126g00018 [Paralvinella palmiformis]|uniref:Uncharacterized protein n=1 Tax=Paralvinella palmiformis TaxID=53620 RepID=A0AAD9IVE3_9ANNE|nr:hypothetical protein LSH36_1126g00018 [Paralvinella palmiformis]
MWAPYGGFRKITSAWIFASLALLFLANIFFLAAFVTNYWGVLYVVRDPGTARPTGGASGGRMLPSTNGSDALNRTSYMDWIWNTWSRIPNAFRAATGTEGRYDRGVRSGRDTSPKMTSLKDKHVVNRMRGRGAEYWIFGLWQCCRNTDGLCLGPRFEAFYMATRTLCVLSLFLMILSFAWMMGHTLEKLLDYDICTMSCLISMCYLTSIFTTIALICFGIRWPRDFGHEFDGSDPELAYSFYLAAISVPLTFGAAVCSTLDLKTGLEQIRENEKFYSNPDNFTDQTMSSIPRDNISRPRGQKKKRTTYGNSQSPYLFTSEA